MRLDRLLSSAGGLSRSQAAKAVRSGRVSVNGVTALRPEQKVREDADAVLLDGAEIHYAAWHYYLLDKPVGVITASEDRKQETVLDLLPSQLRRQGVFPVGRLDKDTSGLLLITDDGDFAHRVLSPKSGVWKVYEAEVEGSLTQEHVQQFARGLTLRDGTVCLPAGLELLSPRLCRVTVREGRYHQVRRMLAAVGAPVLTLRRLSVGGLKLDADSVPGSWRALSGEEAMLVFR